MTAMKETARRVEEEAALLQKVRDEIGKALVGQGALVERFLLALLCNAHLLIEGVPGLAKTLAVTTLAQALSATFSRIQFTPDLLPADVVGTLIYDPKTGGFTTRKGPVFANIVLADEINRAPAKVQSALLEAMQERQVTIGGETFRLDSPFMVLATQNPVEQEGTYPLPEAQVDRFMMKLLVTYPSQEEERQILRARARTGAQAAVSPVMGAADVFRLRELVDEIYLDEKIETYILNLVGATRDPAAHGLDIANLLRYGASPRATIALALAGRAEALLNGRAYVTPQDIKSIAPDVLRHRLTLTYEAEAEEQRPDEIVKYVLDHVEVP
ncbi:MAG: AAA family ATPase [Planctomycetes bacterium]|nr:AAA family ATPase [Planctomycetota bacterium]